MKKKCVIIMATLLFVSCNNDNQMSNVKEGLTFEDIENVKSQGFNFNKKNNYSTSVQNNSEAEELDSHNGCTAPCCADK